MSEADLPLEARVALNTERLKQLQNTVEAFGPTARQVIEASAQLEIQARELADQRQDLERAEGRLAEALKRVESACGKVGDKLDAQLEKRSHSRATIIVGLLGIAGTIVAALVSHG